MNFNEITSAFTPFSSTAELMDQLYWIMIYLFGAVFAVVVLFSVITIFSKRADKPKPPFGDSAFIAIFGLILPGIILTYLLIHTLVATAKIKAPKADLTIEITGHMWWWDVRYPDHGIHTANEIIIPVGKSAEIILRSADVIHSLWIPSLSGKTDLNPGLVTRHWLNASRAGVYRGQCAEFCGLQHAKMAIHAVAVSDEEFQQWTQQMSNIPEAANNPKFEAARKTFSQVGCATCHTIHGTDAQGKVGPDLTHIARRTSIGAGTLPMSRGNLGGWIANPQAIKPGNKMPATYLPAEQLEPLLDYMMSLK